MIKQDLMVIFLLKEILCKLLAEDKNSSQLIDAPRLKVTPADFTNFG